LHSITLDAGQHAVVGEMIRPLTKGYGASVPVISVSGRHIITGWAFLPLNTKGAEVTFQVISVPR
jgi:hypothetical protein